MKHRAALVLLVAAACGDRTPQILQVPAAGSAADRTGQLTVTGTATLEVSPDCADLTMTLSADGARPGLATHEVQAKQDKLVAALTKLGIATTDLKLSYLTLNPLYESGASGYAELVVHTYRANITVTATTHKFDQISGIMEAGADAGASAMSSVFRRDLAELKKQVREMALVAAQTKATQTAKTLGIKLGRIISVGESTGGSMLDNAYSNSISISNGGGTLGGALKSLTLDITIGYELPRDA